MRIAFIPSFRGHSLKQSILLAYSNRKDGLLRRNAARNDNVGQPGGLNHRAGATRHHGQRGIRRAFEFGHNAGKAFLLKNKTRRFRDIFFVLLSTTFVVTSAFARDFKSPDNTLIVSVLSKNGLANEESELEIRDRSGKVLFKKNYESSDGQHGEIVDLLKWTPDSNFFVFSMYSSGGHQPWYCPIDFYSRHSNNIFPIDGSQLTITDPNFNIVAHDEVEVFGEREGAGDSSWVRVNLSVYKAN